MTSEAPNNASRRTVLITGGSRGLGRSFVHAFSREGYDVYFTYHARTEEGSAVEKEITDAGRFCRSFQMDVRNAEQIASVIQTIQQESGGIAVLINNAGVAFDGVSWKLSDQKWQDTIDVNVSGAFKMIRAVLPSMREKGFGRIVNISSVVGLRGIAGTAAYAASKAALLGLTRTVAKEVAAKGITVNSLVLGYFEAGMGTVLPPEFKQQTLNTIPAGRFGDPEKLGSIVTFLCSDACDYITGQEIVIDGGFLS